MLIVKMAFRNIFRQRRRSILTGLTMVGGCAFMSMALGMADGMYGDVINMFTKNHTGHVQIHSEGYLKRPNLYNTIDNTEQIMEKIREVERVEYVMPRINSGALAFVGTKTAGAVVQGIDPAIEAAGTNFDKKIEIGKNFSGDDVYEVVLGSGVAGVLDVSIGDELALIGQAADGSIANNNFTIAGVLSKSGASFDKMTVYIPIKTAENFFELHGRTHEIVVILDKYKYSRATAKKISSRIQRPDLETDPWEVVEKEFYHAMQKDMQGNYILQVIIMVIVALGVLNTVLMSILERTREFGVIKAMGTRPFMMFWLIILETAFLALLSVIVGTAIGLLLNYILTIYGLMEIINYFASFFGKEYPVSFEYGGVVFSSFKGAITFHSIGMPAIITYLSAVFVSIIPAIRAARITPVEAMRNI